MDATPLDALLPPPGAAPQNAPPLPASTTYTPVVTPGTMQYSGSPMPGPPQATAFYVKSILRTIVQYLAVFLAAFGLSLPQVQSLGLRYVPNAYTSGGVLSLTGAAVVGVSVVLVSYILQSFLVPILV